MDKAAMQNLFMYGNNGSAMNGAPMNSPQPGDNSNGGNNMVMYQQGDQQAAAQGYNPLYSMGYLNQNQAAAHAHAAAAMAEQRLSGYGGPQSYSYDPNTTYSQYGAAPAPEGSNGGGEYMDPNRLLYQRMQPQPAGTWMNYGSTGMPPVDMAAENGFMAPWSATSAGLLGKLNPEQEKKKVVRKKHKDKPKRPLSAYNIFFKEERARILESIPSATKKDEANEQDAERKGGRKRKKTPHGKIGFENLAKIIGQRWQELKEDKAEKYKKLAAEDMKRYKEQMEVFLTKLEDEKKKAEGGVEESEVGHEESAEEPDAKRIKIEEEGQQV